MSNIGKQTGMVDRRGNPRLGPAFVLFLLCVMVFFFLVVTGSTQNYAYVMVTGYILFVIGILSFRRWK